MVLVLMLVLELVLKRGSIVWVVWVKDWDLHGLRRHGRCWVEEVMKRGERRDSSMIDSSTPGERVESARLVDGDGDGDGLMAMG
jgi:hypothetical protein